MLCSVLFESNFTASCFSVGNSLDMSFLCWPTLSDNCDISRDAGTGGAGGAAAPLAFCWEGQGGQKCPLSIKNII